MVVSAYRDDMRYDVPDESGRVEKAIASFQAAGTGDCHIGAGPGAHTRGMVAIGAMCCGLPCRTSRWLRYS